MDLIYHERQEGSLCAQHCLNALLQGDYYSAVDLASIAEDLDKQEQAHMLEAGVTQDYKSFLKQDSSNYDDSGFFSIQVLQKALKNWSLDLIPYMSTAAQHEQSIHAYVLNFKEHWYTIRMIANYWFNLNSMFTRPELITDTYLSILLAQLQNDGYSIFIVTGTLPVSPAEKSLLERPLDVRNILERQRLNLSKKPKNDESSEDQELKEALRMSLLESDMDMDLNKPSISRGKSKQNADLEKLGIWASQIITDTQPSTSAAATSDVVVDHEDVRNKRLAFLDKMNQKPNE